jgi:hypothetical protein
MIPSYAKISIVVTSALVALNAINYLSSGCLCTTSQTDSLLTSASLVSIVAAVSNMRYIWSSSTSTPPTPSTQPTLQPQPHLQQGINYYALPPAQSHQVEGVYRI